MKDKNKNLFKKLKVNKIEITKILIQIIIQKKNHHTKINKYKTRK
jgi:hypothetical protein